MVVTNPGMKPCSLRVDQLDRDTDESVKKKENAKSCSSRDNHYRSSSRERSRRENDSEQQDKYRCESPLSTAASSADGYMDSQCDNDLSENAEVENYYYPEIVHFGIRPPQLSYAGNPE